MLRLKFFTCAILAGIAVAGLAPSARADFQVSVSAGGGTVTYDWNITTGATSVTTSGTINAGTSNVVTGNDTGGAFVAQGTQTVPGTASTATYVVTTSSFLGVGELQIGNLSSGQGLLLNGFLIQLSTSNSNQPGTPTMADITQSNTNIYNASGASGLVTITTSGSPFTNPAPAGGISVFTTASGTTLQGTDSATYSSTISGTPAGSVTVSGTGSASGNTTVGLSGVTAPYTIQGAMAITVGAGDMDTGLSAGTTVTPTPAPSSWLLTGLGTIILAGCVWVRRRGAILAA